MVYVMEFAERLQALMAERGISERELARQAHCDRSYIHLLKQGKRRAGRRMAQLLDDALGAGGALAALAAHAEPPLPRTRVSPQRKPSRAVEAVQVSMPGDDAQLDIHPDGPSH